MQSEVGLIAMLLLGTAGLGALLLGGDDDGGSAESTPQDPDTQDAEQGDGSETEGGEANDGTGEADGGTSDENPLGTIADLPGDSPSQVSFSWHREGGYDNRFPGTAPDPISGLGGNDELYGHEDEIIHNIIFGGELIEIDTPYGFAGGNDTIGGGPGNDWLVGQGGDDTISGHSGEDWINGSPGDDLLFGGLGQDHVHGGTGNDRVFLGFGDDVNFFAPTFITMFEQGSIDAFHQAMDDDRDGSLFIGFDDPDPEYRDLWRESGAEGLLVAGNDVGTSAEAADRYGLNSERPDLRLIYDNLGDDLIRGGARMTDSDGNYVDPAALEDGGDTIVDPMGSNTIFGDLGDDVIMTFDRDLYWSDSDGNGVRDRDDPQFREINPDTVFGGFGDDLIFADAGDTVTLDPIEDDVEFTDRLVVGAEFSEYNTDKTINQETVEVTDFNPDQDQLVIMNYVQDDGSSTYEGELSFEAVTGGTAVLIGTQNLVTLQGVSPDQLTEGGNVVHDTDKTPGSSLVNAIFSNFNAGG